MNSSILSSDDLRAVRLASMTKPLDCTALHRQTVVIFPQLHHGLEKHFNSPHAQLVANMARFQNMPDDILVVILRFISHDALPAIAQVSTSFNRCTTLPLCRFVHLWDVCWRIQHPPEFPDSIQGTHPPCGSISHAARRDTRIFYLDLFLRTMRESRSLRNLVVGASFDCQILEHDDQVISEIVQLLSPSTRFIHLRPLRYNPGSEYFSCLTSLEIEADHLGSDYDQAYAERDKLYALFYLSNLQSLSVIGVRC